MWAGAKLDAASRSKCFPNPVIGMKGQDDTAKGEDTVEGDNSSNATNRLVDRKHLSKE